jgi:hypothetical protein
MSIHHSLFCFRRTSFCQLVQRIANVYGIQGLEAGVKATARTLRDDHRILDILDQCGGWNHQTLVSDIESDKSLAIFCLALFCCEDKKIAVPDQFLAGSLRSTGLTLADACKNQLEDAIVPFLVDWRPPATSSAAYFVDAKDMTTDNLDLADIQSILILRDCDLLHIVHG